MAAQVCSTLHGASRFCLKARWGVKEKQLTLFCMESWAYCTCSRAFGCFLIILLKSYSISSDSVGMTIPWFCIFGEKWIWWLWGMPCRYKISSGARHVVVLVPDGDVISTVDEHAGRSQGLPSWYPTSYKWSYGLWGPSLWLVAHFVGNREDSADGFWGAAEGRWGQGRHWV